ncbi:MAG: SBBP repeat-containing protein, partial [Bacteroidota bacterium]
HHPSSHSVTAGSTATFSVTGSGTSPFTYQWYKNSSQLSGETLSTYTTPTLTLSDNGNIYYCHLTNCSGNSSINSNNATLTVTSSCTGVSIQNQPTNQTANVGNTASFSVVTNGSSPFTYQWYKNGTLITGANSATYTTPILTLTDNGSTFYCIITNCSGINSLPSSTVTLTVIDYCNPVWIAASPSNQISNIGGTATFSVTPSGTAPFTYQWYKNNSMINGANFSNFTTPALTQGDNGNAYYCKVTNCSGNYVANSNPATLTVSSNCNSIDWVWARSGGSTSAELAYSTAADSYGNVYVAGTFTSSTLVLGSQTLTNAGGYDIMLIKYDQSGNVVWAKSAGGADNEMIYSIAVDGSGNVYVAGYYQSTSITFGATTLNNSSVNAGYGDIFLTKYASNGVVIWAQSAVGTLNKTDWATSVALDATGNVYLTGRFSSSTMTFGSYTLTNVGSSDIFLAKYNSSGTVLWATSAGGASYEYPYSVAVDPSGNVYVAGYFDSSSLSFGSTTLTNTGSGDLFLAKYNTNGTPLWARSAVGTGTEIAYSIATDNSGNIFMTGAFDSPSLTFGTTILTNAGVCDIFLVKYDANGSMQFATKLGGTGDDKAYSIAVDNSGHVYLAGYFSNSVIIGTTTLNSIGSFDILQAKYDASGNPIWAKSTGGTSNDNANSIAINASGYIYVAGTFLSTSISFGTTTITNAGSNDMFLAKLSPFTVNILPANVNCNGSINGTATANVIGGGIAPFTYLWNTTPAQTSQTAISLPAGNYTVTITDNLGATNSACVDITQPSPLSITITPSNSISICQSNSVTISETSGYSGYLWSPHGETTNSITANTAGTYSVTITNSSGCTASSSPISVTVNTIPSAAGTITGSGTVCQGQNSVVYTVPSIANATSYIWTLPNGATGTSSTNSISVNFGLTATSDNISVHGNNYCGDGTISNLFLAVVPKPNAFAGNDTTICNGHSITLTATGGNSYIWNHGVSQGVSFSPTTSNTY